MRGRRKKRRVAFRFYVLLFVALCVFLYAGYLAISSMFTKTAVITAGDMGNQYHANAVVVRNEALTTAEGLTSITYYADEGEIVYKGNKIAEIYSTGYSQTDMNKLLNIRSQIKAQHKALAASSYTDLQLDRMNTNVLSIAADIRSVARKEATGNLLNLMRQMDTAMANRQSYLKTKYASDQNLSNLYRDESSLLKKIASWTITYIADSDCIVSFYTDGYENALPFDTADEITAGQIRAVLNGDDPQSTAAERGRTPVFRTVQNGSWYLMLLTNDKNWNPVTGQSYKVQLEGFDDTVFDATVTSFARSGSELLVRMSVPAKVRAVLNTRTAKATVGELYVSGLQVPLNALRQQNGETGVVLTDNGGLFVPVDVVMQDNRNAVIVPKSVGALSEGQKVLLF